ncbi:SPBC32H8.01c UPF0589 protein C32H8.01c [Candida maltosa Xu316]|uniref:VPS4-associated protein 1 n=1 Tax=Candida maltosa (strain Xu316) TaxID=1245528 RepID=M3K468_CANMX|nr:hypothetical protein G210_4937 [Candida maltosa Xu316]
MSKPQPQQQTPPFPNKYHVKLVSSSDSKACIICYKPSTTVLLADGNGDFFYVCPGHLLDEQFASPIHPQEYSDLISSQKELTDKKAKLEKDLEMEKPYIWNTVAGYWKDKKEKGEETKYDKLKKELGEVTKGLEDKTKSVNGYKFKLYKLHQDIYKGRIMAHQKKVYSVQRATKIQQEGFFPSVPSHNLE